MTIFGFLLIIFKAKVHLYLNIIKVYVPKYNVTQNICKVFLIAFGYINFGDLLTWVQIYAFIGIYAAVIIISISMCGNKDFVDYTLRVINAVIVVWEASLYFSMHSTLQNNVFA